MARASSVKKLIESDVERPVVKYARDRLGLKVTKMRLLGDAGMPDNVVWLPGGRCALIEFKRPGKQPEPHQWNVIQHMRKLGYPVYVVDDVARGKELADALLAEARGTGAPAWLHSMDISDVLERVQKTSNDCSDRRSKVHKAPYRRI